MEQPVKPEVRDIYIIIENYEYLRIEENLRILSFKY